MESFLIIPEYEIHDLDDYYRYYEGYPGNIEPGAYTRNQVVELLRKHSNDPDVILFLADMLEE